MQTTTDTTTAPAISERDQILSLMETFIRSRPGLEFANYGDVSAYRSESRAITRDRDHALTLLRYVRWTSIDATALREAFRGAFGGRLTLGENRVCKDCHRDPALQHDHAPRFTLSYCAGQYYPTEYRRAACAVLASAIWAYWRDNLGEPEAWQVCEWGARHMDGHPTKDRAIAEQRLTESGGRVYGHVVELHANARGDWLPAGDYLRAKARAEFGRTIASRWFN